VNRAKLRAAARKILRAGLDAVEPGRLLDSHLRRAGNALRISGTRVRPRRLFVVAVGKAAVPMAQAAHRILGGQITSAIVIAPQRPPKMRRTAGFTAGHPVPDGAGVRASHAVIRLLRESGEGDVILLLLSGGASSLMPAPVPGVSLRDKQRLTRLLLRRGASIGELNAVRKVLSRLKGGGFAELAAPARAFTLALSDVPDDDPATIGSGPCVRDPQSLPLARKTVRTLLRGIALPDGVRRALRRSSGVRTPPTDAATTVVIGSGRTFAKAAGEKARQLGFRVHILRDALQGEARGCGPELVGRFRALRGRGPHCLIATGETVVRVLGRGQGGRNQELALAAVNALAQLGRPTVLAALATDGVDGNSPASGGLVDDHTLEQARKMGVRIESALARNDSTTALRLLDAMIVTGPTNTNVADVALLVG